MGAPYYFLLLIIIIFLEPRGSPPRLGRREWVWRVRCLPLLAGDLIPPLGGPPLLVLPPGPPGCSSLCLGPGPELHAYLSMFTCSQYLCTNQGWGEGLWLHFSAVQNILFYIFTSSLDNKLYYESFFFKETKISRAYVCFGQTSWVGSGGIQIDFLEVLGMLGTRHLVQLHPQYWEPNFQASFGL